MPISEEDMNLLAATIIGERIEEIEREYFQETTKKTFQKWYGKGTKGPRPYLDMTRHGGAIISNYDGTYRYYTVNRTKYHFRKSGKRFKPSRKEMAYAVNEAAQLNLRTTIVSQEQNRVVINLEYNRLPYEYAGTITTETGDGGQWQNTEKKGKMSSLDKLILKGIGKWGNELGLKVKVESVYKGSKK